MSNYTYQLVGTAQGYVIQRIQDTAWIPVDSANCDYTAYQAWLAAGNIPVTIAYVPGTPGLPYQPQIDAINILDTTFQSDITTLQTEVAGFLSATIATQAQEEAATSITAVTTPGRAHYHPGMCKAWASISASSGTINASYNVTSITKVQSGEFSLAFTVPMSSANYSVSVTLDFALIASLLQFGVQAGSQTANGFTLIVFSALGILTNPVGNVYIQVCGAQ